MGNSHGALGVETSNVQLANYLHALYCPGAMPMPMLLCTRGGSPVKSSMPSARSQNIKKGRDEIVRHVIVCTSI